MKKASVDSNEEATVGGLKEVGAEAVERNGWI